jgi:hypothetical protein
MTTGLVAGTRTLRGDQRVGWSQLKSYCKGYAITRERVEDAYALWRSGESGRKNAWRVEEEHGSADALIDEIYEQINARTLEFRPIRRYTHIEPTNGKRRVIGVESVKQQVCDYVAVEALRPLIEARLGYYQCAGVRNKGQKLCRKALRRWSTEGGYFVKADIRQCYPSTSPKVVMRMLRRYVRSEAVLYVCEAIMSTYDNGMEIGSYFSLCVINLVLSFAYHHVEGLSKVRRGEGRRLVTHQIWHLDDVLLFSRDKRDLKSATRSLERYLKREFGLSLKGWKVCRNDGGSERPDMGGWVACDGRVTLRKGIFLRGMRAFRRFKRHPTLRRARRVCSYWGWWVHGDLMGHIRDRRLTRLKRVAAKMIRRYDRMVST